MLELYRNIKSRRNELDMTQGQLADLVGYTSRSMISKIEKGEVDLSLEMIEKIAIALKTSSSNLMGYEEDMKEVPEYEPDHIELIDLYSKLTKEQKQTVMSMLRSFVNQ
jgi:transcriptional regulator with XRE-family HTH domain